MNPTAAPREAGLARTAREQGEWLFQWRSYLPLLLLAYIAALQFQGDPPAPAELLAHRAVGFALGVLGLAVRCWAAGQIRPGTSSRGTREIAAADLNTDGLYSVVRHPLYLGNLLMWLGVAFIGGRLHGVLVTVLVFWIYYERIMLAEEAFLHRTFGRRFEEWAGRTPAILPRLRLYRPSELTYSLRYALGRDYQAVYAFVASAVVIEMARSFAAGTGWHLAPAWWGFLAAGTAYYAVIHTLKRRTRVLHVDAR